MFRDTVLFCCEAVFAAIWEVYYLENLKESDHFGDHE
jgi:hypothetical protein